MYREILFRGKRIDNEGWAYGDLIRINKDKTAIIPFIMDFGSSCDDYKVLLDTIGQYTGLKDKYGKKIFEGDIVKIGQRTALVKWNDELATFALQFDFENKVGRKSLGEWDDATVISNIHDNPGLIKQRV